MQLHLKPLLLDLGWFLVLSLLFYHFWKIRRPLVEAQSWLKTKGHITECDWVKSGHTLWPKIEYSYQVYDKDLIGKHLFLDTFHNNPNSKYARHIAYNAAMAFKENSEIEVFYNPNNPEQSALDVSIPTKLNLILLLVGAFLIFQLVSILIHFMGTR